MKILDLNRLVGPGNSVDENFEIMCLELVKVHAPRAFRLKAPDDGLDLYDHAGKRAYQCKAYREFRTDLLASIRKSVKSAQANMEARPFREYILMIPFVPTSKQRHHIIEALECRISGTYICDGDEIESRLFEEPGIASRFFPSITYVLPPTVGELRLLSAGGPDPIRVSIQSMKTGQRLPMLVTPSLSAGGIVNYLCLVLHLPDTFKVDCIGGDISSGTLDWRLARLNGSERLVLPPDASLEQAGVRAEDTLVLLHEGIVKVTGGFSKNVGSVLSLRGALDSTIWSEDEMNLSLLKKEWTERKCKPMEGIRLMLEDFIASHIQGAQRGRTKQND